MLTADEVARNAQTYLEQFFKIVDKDKTEVRRQTEWFDGFDLSDVIKLTRKFTVAQLLKRDDFAKRYEGNQPIAITELLYPLLQAYDSVMVRADIEFGGADQRPDRAVSVSISARMLTSWGVCPLPCCSPVRGVRSQPAQKARPAP